MSGSEPVPPTRDQLLQEAATWFARMRGPEADASREEFEAWLRRGALHRQAYNRASEIFAMGKVLAEDAEAASNGQPPDIKQRSSSGIAWALVALLLLVGAGWFAFGGIGVDERKAPIADGRSPLPPAQILSTTSSGPRTVRLADGSLVTLEADSLLEVRLGASERRLDLRRGSGRFQVFRETRPFVVHAGGGSVVARGTIFDVGFARDRSVTVRLIEGTVDVTYPAQGTTRRLRPGQALSYGVGRGEASMSIAPAPSGTAADRVATQSSSPPPVRDFDGVTLAELVAAANRGSERPIRLVGDALGRLQVSGRFRIDDTAVLAERLALVFDLALESRSDSIVLRAR